MPAGALALGGKPAESPELPGAAGAGFGDAAASAGDRDTAWPVVQEGLEVTRTHAHAGRCCPERHLLAPALLSRALLRDHGFVVSWDPESCRSRQPRSSAKPLSLSNFLHPLLRCCPGRGGPSCWTLYDRGRSFGAGRLEMRQEGSKRVGRREELDAAHLRRGRVVRPPTTQVVPGTRIRP